MRLTIWIDLPKDLDLDLVLERTSDAMFMSDNVTAKDQEFVIHLIQKVIKQKANEDR